MPVRDDFPWSARLSLFGDVGGEPGPAPGARAAVMVRKAWTSITVEIQASLPASASTALGGSVGGTRALASLVPCAHLGVASGCAVASTGVLWIGTSGVTWPGEAAPWIALLGARAGVELPLGRRLYLLADATLTFLVTPVSVRLNGQTVFSASPVDGTGAVGLGVRF
jgi:hypothetical protein